MRILVVEDDEFTAKAISTILTKQSYAVEIATDGQAGWDLATAFDYDLILMDVILPKLDGISLCRKLRSQGYQTPILLLTGKDSGQDKAIGLDAGADDYVVKPFDPQELVARIRALLRRSNATAMPVLTWGELQLDPSTCEANYASKPLQLTRKEYGLLELFLRNNHRVFSCSAILEHVWSYEKAPGEEAVRTQIKGLRQKLKAAGAATDLIETVYGIGYRLKPQDKAPVNKVSQSEIQPKEILSNGKLKSNREVHSSTEQNITSAIAGIWDKFKGKVIAQVEVIERAIHALAEHHLSAELKQQAEREAHTLAGSLGTFGKPKGSELARAIEQELHKLQPEAFKQVKSKEIGRLQELVNLLKVEIQPHGIHEEHAEENSDGEDSHPLLLIVDHEQETITKLVNESLTWGVHTTIATDLETARSKIEHQQPDAVLLDLSVSANSEASLELLAELSRQTPPLPVLVFTERDNLSDRLEVARLGGKAFVQKSATPAQVLEAVTQTIQRNDNNGVVRVLAVDDDPKVLAILRALLEPWGIKLSSLSDPRQLWQTLESKQPNLLILDVEMPHLNGIELCQVVRNDLRWGGLPILVLTAHTDPETVNQVFASGADDFVSKPIVGPELVTRIINRLDRIKQFKNVAETDPVTQLPNRQKSTQDIDKLLRQAGQQQEPACLVILNVDHLKQINYDYGYITGDAVLYQSGQLLRRTLTGQDVIARWGGGEFILMMYGVNRTVCQQRLSKILEDLQQEEFISTDNVKFQVGFTLGVAEYPLNGTSLQALYQYADVEVTQTTQAKLK